MFERTIDKRIVRIILGTAFGLPITALILVASIWGLIAGYGALLAGEILYSGIGVITVLGLLGISGAWRRVLKTHEAMTARERLIVRRFLACGVIASIALALLAFVYIESTLLALFLVLLALGGGFFVLATPTAL